MKTIVIEDVDPDVAELWLAAAGVVALIPGKWVLVGGLMVQLHAIERGEMTVRRVGTVAATQRVSGAGGRWSLGDGGLAPSDRRSPLSLLKSPANVWTNGRRSG